MDDETYLINKKNSSDCSDDEERRLLFSTPTSSFVGHEKYIEKLLENFSNNSYDDYLDKIDLDILQSKCNIFDENNYIPFTSKNDKIIDKLLFDVNAEGTKICSTTTDDTVCVEMENHILKDIKIKNKNLVN